MVHIEDLPLERFVKLVGDLPNLPAGEKLDGSALTLGRDETGIFTKRDGSQKFYKEADYPLISSYNGFRSAADAIFKTKEFAEVLSVGDIIEMEILYGEQPNAIMYGKDDLSYIAFLSGDKVPQLAAKLKGKTITVDVKNLQTTDGKTLNINNVKTTFKYVVPQLVDMSKLPMGDITKLTEELTEYLKVKNAIGDESLTNGEIITTPLTKVAKPIRPEVKSLRDNIIAHIGTSYKIPVKNILNKFVSTIASQFSKENSVIPLEGIVIDTPEGLVKIVDKDAFTTLNIFNYNMRSLISSPIKSILPTASQESRGGITGELKIKIADLLGNQEFARSAYMRKTIKSLPGETPTDKLKALESNLSINDFQGIKRKILALVNQTKLDINALLDDYQNNYKDYKLVLASGDVIGITDEIHNRTLLSFAETFKNLNSTELNFQRSDNTLELITFLYGHYANQKLDESIRIIPILLEKRLDTDKLQFKNKDAYTLMNMYFANLLLSMLIFKANDKRGIYLLKDKTHHRMTSLNSDMSPLNFFGYPIWKSSTDAVKKLIGAKAANAIARVVKRIPASYSRYLHLDLSYGQDMPIEWTDHLKTLRMLQQFDGMNTSRINKLISGIFNYENLDLEEQVALLNRLYYYTTQFIPLSPLFLRLKIIQQNLVLNANKENTLMIVKEGKSLLMQLENEDFNGFSVGETTNFKPKTTVANIERRVEKRRRNPNVVQDKFPKPKESIQ